MHIKISSKILFFEINYESNTLVIILKYRDKTLINIEKYYPKYFNCCICNERIEDEDQKLRMCEKHSELFIQHIQMGLDRDGFI